MTPWGTFSCERATCEASPPGVQGFFLRARTVDGVPHRETLAVVTDRHEPLAFMGCEPRGRDTWVCDPTVSPRVAQPGEE